MPRRTRKELVGKTENYEQRERDRLLCWLRRQLRWLWLTQAEDATLTMA